MGALVDYVGSTKGNTRLPGIMALGYIAAFTETLALSVIAEKGLVSLNPVFAPRLRDPFAPSLLDSLSRIQSLLPSRPSTHCHSDGSQLCCMHQLEKDLQAVLSM